MRLDTLSVLLGHFFNPCNKERAMDPMNALIVEWVLSCGSLPGFNERLEATKASWSISAEPFTVSRGQGHSKKGIPSLSSPQTLQSTIRPLISTSRSRDSSIKYTGPDCCLFKINVQPGVRFIDIEAVFHKEDFNPEPYIAQLKALLPPPPEAQPKTVKSMIKAELIAELDSLGLPTDGVVLTLQERLEGARPPRIIDRYGFLRAPVDKLARELKQRIETEHEVLLEGGGDFSPLVQIGKAEFETSYTQAAGAEGGGKRKRRTRSLSRLSLSRRRSRSLLLRRR